MGSLKAGRYMPSILLVEDTETILRMYTYGLEREGFTVFSASSGGEALEKLAGARYEVVILDLMLSGMSGLDVLTEYNVKTESPHTKLVVLTSVDNQHIIERAEAFRIDGYLVKSDYEPAALARYVRNLLKQPDVLAKKPQD